MERSREEMGRIHKKKCGELKLVRAKMAEELGVELHQRECTYAGYCSGTCPKCAEEERLLNEAFLRREAERLENEPEKAANSTERKSAAGRAKGRVLAAGLAAIVSIGLSGCSVPGELEGDTQMVDGGMDYVTEEELQGEATVDLEGSTVMSEDTEKALTTELGE